MADNNIFGAGEKDDNSKNRKKVIRNILVVDDEPELVEILQKFLKQSGYECQKETCPVKVLEIFNADIDLLITDISMPRMNGIELIRNIRKRTDGYKVKIIILSGHSNLVKTETIEELRISKTISKPIDLYELEKIIQEI